MATAQANVGPQRVVAVLILVVAGILSLPVAAAFFDDEGTENWILPVQLLGMAIVGAIVGRLLPGLAGEGATASRATLVGAAAGLVAALAGVVIFFLLLSGFEGA
jgi:drug/metabolite transporter (DMT)-like permease